MPSDPVSIPIAKLPSSRTTDPLARISWTSSRRRRASRPAVSPARASRRPVRIAGVSMTATTAAKKPSKGMPRLERKLVAAT